MSKQSRIAANRMEDINMLNSNLNPSYRAQAAIKTARENAHKAEMQTSAQLCIEDAEGCLGRGDYNLAIARAKASLSYSVGVFAAAYVDC